MTRAVDDGLVEVGGHLRLRAAISAAARDPAGGGVHRDIIGAAIRDNGLAIPGIGLGEKREPSDPSVNGIIEDSRRLDFHFR